jgi:hypothetical protein
MKPQREDPAIAIPLPGGGESQLVCSLVGEGIAHSCHLLHTDYTSIIRLYHFWGMIIGEKTGRHVGVFVRLIVRKGEVRS